MERTSSLVRRESSAMSGTDTTVSNTVTFPAGVLETNVAIPLINDLVYRGNRSFTITLSNASAGWTLANPNNAIVTITDDDSTATTNSFTDVVAPSAAPAALGSLQVTLLPAQAVGSWRFTWETEWRSSEDIATGLVPGEHPVEFIPRGGFITPEVTNVLIYAGFNALTNTYSTNGVAEYGALSVNLSPAEVQSGTNRGQWRLQAEETGPRYTRRRRPPCPPVPSPSLPFLPYFRGRPPTTPEAKRYR